MVEPAERLQAAVDDLFGVPRAKALENASIPRLSGIRELYLTLTGDYELHGGTILSGRSWLVPPTSAGWSKTR
jgi:hypothetical protein